MKKYIIKPEHLDDFGADCTMNNRTITRDIIEMCAQGWEKSVEEVLDMVEEVEDVEAKTIFLLAIRTASHGGDRSRWFWTRDEALAAYDEVLDSMTVLALQNLKSGGEIFLEERAIYALDGVTPDEALLADPAAMRGGKRIISHEVLL